MNYYPIHEHGGPASTWVAGVTYPPPSGCNTEKILLPPSLFSYHISQLTHYINQLLLSSLTPSSITYCPSSLTNTVLNPLTLLFLSGHLQSYPHRVVYHSVGGAMLVQEGTIIHWYID